jgi:hypothetical protein
MSPRAPSLALLAGSVAGLVTMAVHPTGHQIIANAQSGSANALNTFAHSLALLAQPLLLAGTLGLTLRMRAQRDVAVAGYIFYALGVVAVMIAGVASGFLAPATLSGYRDASDTARQGMLAALAYTGRINQAFAKVSVGLESIAILLWSAAMWRGRELSRGLAMLGMVLSVVFLLGIATGHLRLDVHGFGAVVVGQSVWLIWAAWLMRRQVS